uniref:Dead end protein 1 n=1 Tax=Fundulus heteroclitus TaxID=8078 RepID=A0A3Q2SUI8_FUNHE
KMEDMRTQVSIQQVQALEAWLKTTNIKLTQVNGQRKYGGPPEVWDGPTPGERCEVFIGHIPRDTYEDVLIPLFSSVGPLWEFRLMMNFSGQNRGFAYAKYGTPALASEAISKLNGYTLEPNWNICVRQSTEKRCLCIQNLPPTSDQEVLMQVLQRLVDCVERVSLKAGSRIKGVSAVVAFSSHYTASMAKKELEKFRKRFSLEVTVIWDPEENLKRKLTWVSRKAPRILPQPCFMPDRQHMTQPSALRQHLPVPPRVSQGFCRAVGEPLFPRHPQSPFPLSSSPNSQQHMVCAASTGTLSSLRYVSCIGLSTPHDYSHFSYRFHNLWDQHNLQMEGRPARIQHKQAQMAAQAA